MFYITITDINKCFKFKNGWFKTIYIKYNCTEFCPKRLCLKNQKFRKTAQLLKGYTPKVTIYARMQINLEFSEILPFSFCTFTTTKSLPHPDRQAFFKNSQIVFRTPQSV